MIIEGGKKQLGKILIKQLNSFFPKTKKWEKEIIEASIEETIPRLTKCFEKINNKYYKNNSTTYFSPAHSGQYCAFLYYLSNNLYKHRQDTNITNKIYTLSRIIGSNDVFYKSELPEVFFWDHTTGIVLGQASYGNYLTISQNCSVGNNKGIYPSIGKYVTMYSNSQIIGNSKIGNCVVLSAGTIIVDTDIPSNSIVFGRSPNLEIKTLGEEQIQKYLGLKPPQTSEGHFI